MGTNLEFFNRERILLKNDLAFKIVFARDTDECKFVLKSLLEAILNIRIDEIIYHNPIVISDKLNIKEPEFDIKVSINGSMNCDVEIQLRDHIAFKKRLVYYGAMLMQGDLKKTQSYTHIKNAIVICLTDFILLDNTQQYKSNFIMKERDTNIELSDVLEIITLEMPKVDPNKPLEQMTDIERWLFYLKHSGEDIYTEKLQKIIKESEAITMAEQIFDHAKSNNEAYNKMIDHMRAQVYNVAIFNDLAEYKLNEGKIEERMNFINNLYNDNLPIPTISKYTKLPEDEVRRIISTFPPRPTNADSTRDG